MKKAIITGAAGFAGYSTTIELLNRGYEVYAILHPGSLHNARFDGADPKLHKIELDCSEFDMIPAKIDCPCDVFFHLAWFGNRDDFAVQKNNVFFSIKALESASKLGCRRFVGIGSQAEYGVYSKIMSETLRADPINAYGASKTAAMYLSKIRAEQFGIEWIWGRIFSLYGDFEPSGRLLPDLIDALMANRNIVLSSCEQNWDYLHVKDSANAIVTLCESGHPGEIYNIANGDYKPLKLYVEEIRKILSYKGSVTYGDKANPFISLQPDVSKIRAHTGWKPVISFNEGVKRIIDEKNKCFDSVF